MHLFPKAEPMNIFTLDTSRLPRHFTLFATAMLLLALLGGYLLAQLFAQTGASTAQRSIRLFEIEEQLDDAAISLGRQVQEWKNMLLRANDQALYSKHQQAFKEASIDVQYALLSAKAAMQELGMDMAEIDGLIVEHKSLLSEYLVAYSKLAPHIAESPGAVDLRVMGVDRKLHQRIASVKSGISEYAKRQMSAAPRTLGNRYLMTGLLGAASLFFMALFGYLFACHSVGRHDVTRE